MALARQEDAAEQDKLAALADARKCVAAEAEAAHSKELAAVEARVAGTSAEASATVAALTLEVARLTAESVAARAASIEALDAAATRNAALEAALHETRSLLTSKAQSHAALEYVFLYFLYIIFL